MAGDVHLTPQRKKTQRQHSPLVSCQGQLGDGPSVGTVPQLISHTFLRHFQITNTQNYVLHPPVGGQGQLGDRAGVRKVPETVRGDEQDPALGWRHAQHGAHVRLGDEACSSGWVGGGGDWVCYQLLLLLFTLC